MRKTLSKTESGLMIAVSVENNGVFSSKADHLS